ncbi:MAG: hypothetical protein G3M78_06050 [Candidatus Nitrohelix vancouverensis]|uniref:Tetratricopeptide repeat protein n=1 Tax=Candidatus Nitrohelix vancouverensis TaxID=2705534 RepID=A0A7T0C1S8_9BACT|nr:MAG: hypothetical protein G3M78_06050 [Candidatus Nitrohelix vancouverensis]
MRSLRPIEFKFIVSACLILTLAGAALINNFHAPPEEGPLTPPIDSPDEAGRYIQMASQNFFYHEYDEALENYQHAIQILEARGDFRRAARLYESIGDVHKFFHDLQAAEENYIFAIDYHARIGDTIGAGKAMTHLAELEIEKGAPDNAEIWYVKAVDTVKTLEPSRAQAEVYERLGRYYWNAKRDADALPIIARARDIFAALKHQAGYDHMAALIKAVKSRQRSQQPG